MLLWDPSVVKCRVSVFRRDTPTRHRPCPDFTMPTLGKTGTMTLNVQYK